MYAEAKPDRTDSFQYRYRADGTHFERAWCHSDAGDFCPLVIISMSIIIILSLVLIVFLCTTNSFGFKYIHNIASFLRRKLRKTNQDTRLQNAQIFRRPIYTSSQSSGASPSALRPSNLAILHSLEAPASRTSTITGRLLSRLNNFGSFLSSRSSTSSAEQNFNVWFVDAANHVRPPPSYEESQHTERVNVESGARIVSSKCTPLVTQSSSYNIAFSMENIDESQLNACRTVFPSYRCMTLTTDTLSAQPTVSLLAQKQGNLVNYSVDSLPRVLDEVPPPYEQVVVASPSRDKNKSSKLSRTRSLFNSGVSLANARRLYSTMNKASTRRELVI